MCTLESGCEVKAHATKVVFDPKGDLVSESGRYVFVSASQTSVWVTNFLPYEAVAACWDQIRNTKRPTEEWKKFFDAVKRKTPDGNTLDEDTLKYILNHSREQGHRGDSTFASPKATESSLERRALYEAATTMGDVHPDTDGQTAALTSLSKATAANTKHLVLLKSVVQDLDVSVCGVENAVGGNKSEQFPAAVCDRLDDLAVRSVKVEDRLDLVEDGLPSPDLIDHLIKIKGRFGVDFDPLIKECGNQIGEKVLELLQPLYNFYNAFTNPPAHSSQPEAPGDKLSDKLQDLESKLLALELSQQNQGQAFPPHPVGGNHASTANSAPHQSTTLPPSESIWGNSLSGSSQANTQVSGGQQNPTGVPSGSSSGIH